MIALQEKLNQIIASDKFPWDHGIAITQDDDQFNFSSHWDGDYYSYEYLESMLTEAIDGGLSVGQTFVLINGTTVQGEVPE